MIQPFSSSVWGGGAAMVAGSSFIGGYGGALCCAVAARVSWIFSSTGSFFCGGCSTSVTVPGKRLFQF